VFNVEEHATCGPVELVAEFSGVAVTPVWPGLVPGLVLLGRRVYRYACGEKRPMIVGELEPVRPLDTVELRVSEARSDFVSARAC
jgi:hypothetical protein